MAGRGHEREFLLDVSRLIWRAWRGRPATGIDRVCLAYLEHFADRAQAVIQRQGAIFVLSPRQSDLMFRLLLTDSGRRRALAWRLAVALTTSSRSPSRPRSIYLNVGHTGLNEPSLPRWIARHEVRAIYLIHDLIPVTHPQYCRPSEAEKHERRMVNALVSATGIIANSSLTLGELASFARLKSIPMPAATVSWIAGFDASSRAHRQRLDRPYFVTVGTIEARKNHLMLLRAWAQLVQEMGAQAPVLVIIGERGWEAEDAISNLDRLNGLASHVHEISGCTDGELADWIGGARALLMPSFAEGFGLPVVEALDLGTPVIANDLTVYREIVGEIPTYLRASDFAAWARMVQLFMGDSPERERQLAQMSNYQPTRWRNHFDAVERWLNEL